MFGRPLRAGFRAAPLGGRGPMRLGSRSFPAPIAPPTLNATAAYAVNITTGQPYYTKNRTTSTTPASLTKLMTAYVLLQWKSEAEIASETTTFLSGDNTAGSGENLNTGDIITLHSLLADAMLPSSNEACTAIARVVGQHILDTESGGAGDPVARFVAEMNDYATPLGLTASVWKNQHGLDASPNNETCALDVCTLMGLLWAYDTMVDIWALGETYAMPLTRGSPTTVTITSSNLMIDDAGVVGGKTGTTSVANLAILWQAPNSQIVALAAMHAGTTGRYDDVRAMIARLPTDFPELA